MVSSFIKVGLTLAILSLVTTFLSSLMMMFVIQYVKFNYIIALVLQFLGIAIIIYNIYAKLQDHRSNIYKFVGIYDIVVPFIFYFLSSDFHVEDSYLNQFSIYILIFICFETTISLLWTIVTSMSFGDVLSSTSFDKNQETVLYFILSLFYSLLLALVYPISQSPYNSEAAMTGFEISIAVWFISAIISFGAGYFITTKGGSGSMNEGMMSSESADYNSVH